MMLLFSGFMFSLMCFVPLALGIAAVLAATTEAQINNVPKRALRIWATILIGAAIFVILVEIAQDPWLVTQR